MPPFLHLTYTEAIDLLGIRSRTRRKSSSSRSSGGWTCRASTSVGWWRSTWVDPVIVTDYPAGIKLSYMRDNEDGKTVAAMDVLVPGIGEIIGGSQREERLDVLKKKAPTSTFPRSTCGGIWRRASLGRRHALRVWHGF